MCVTARLFQFNNYINKFSQLDMYLPYIFNRLQKKEGVYEFDRIYVFYYHYFS